MNDIVIIGIDSGANGGIAIMCGGFLPRIRTKNAQEIAQALRIAKDYAERKGLPIIAFFETLTGYQKGRPMPSQRAFTMGKFYGMIIGSLVSLNIQFRDVRPQEWQDSYPDCKDSKSYPNHKKLLREKAKSLYPRIKVTSKTADAILIARYGKGVIENEA